LKNAVYKPGN